MNIIKAYGANDAVCYEIKLDKLKEFIFERGGKEDTFEDLVESYKSLIKMAFSQLEAQKNGEKREIEESKTGE
jgi:hypothetical protein